MSAEYPDLPGDAMLADQGSTGYFVGLHILGIISLVPWIYHAHPKYQDYLQEEGINKGWW